MTGILDNGASPKGSEAASGPSVDGSTPPREWFEETFVIDGEIIYCSSCLAIPFAFIGHACMGIEAQAGGWAAERVTAPYSWEHVQPVESDYRRGAWGLIYCGPRDRADGSET